MYTQILRRASFVALLLIGSLSACKQQSDPKPQPELSSLLSGQYTLTQISSGNQTRSAAQVDLKGGAKVSRVSANSVNMELDINFASTNEGFLNGTLSDLTLTDAGNNEVEFAKGSDKLGRGGVSKLTFNIKSGDGTVYGLIMTK